MGFNSLDESVFPIDTIMDVTRNITPLEAPWNAQTSLECCNEASGWYEPTYEGCGFEESAIQIYPIDQLWSMNNLVQEEADACGTHLSQEFSSLQLATENALDDTDICEICPISQPSNLESDGENLQSLTLCICCKSKQVELLSISCRHAALCESCGLSAIICPICEEIIIGTIKIYLDFTLQLRQFL